MAVIPSPKLETKRVLSSGESAIPLAAVNTWLGASGSSLPFPF